MKEKINIEREPTTDGKRLEVGKTVLCEKMMTKAQRTSKGSTTTTTKR
jgi:hypothetical protein